MGSVDTTIGTLLVGIFFNTYLYGLVTYQFAAYYWTKFNDPPAIKYMVLFLFILDTFHSASAIYLAWYYCVANYGNPTVLEVVVWPYLFTPGGTALAALVTQMYLGFRIWRLTNSRILYGVVIVLATPSFVFGLTCSIEASILYFVSELPRATPLAIAWLSLQFAVDAFITVTLVTVFSRSRTGFRKMDTVLNRLIRGAIQTGLFAGLFAMGDLFTFIFLPEMNLYGMFAMPIGRIYTNTLLDTLLTRQLLNTTTNGLENVSVAIDTMHWPPADSQVIPVHPSTSIHLEV